MLVFFLIAAGALGITAGITAGKLIEKAAGGISTVGGLFPKGTLDPIPDVPDPANPGKTKAPIGKIITVAILGSIGILIVKWVSKKLRIKLFK